MEHTKITLDCSSSVFIAPDRLIVSLKGGEIYIVTLLTDSESSRSIRNFNIEKGPSSVIPTCLTKCCDNYLFISSRLGNSVLLKYNVKSSNKNELDTVATDVNDQAKEAENGDDDDGNLKNSEELDYELTQTEFGLNAQAAAADGVHKKDCDELDLILEKNEEMQNIAVNIVSYTFEICDMLLNVAPCGTSIIGESTGDYSEFETDSIQYHVDLVGLFL